MPGKLPPWILVGCVAALALTMSGTALATGVQLTGVASSSAAEAGPTAASATNQVVSGSAVDLAASPGRWPSAGHDLDNSRNNPVERTLGPGNVASLRPEWAVDLPKFLTSTPSVIGGAVYLPDQAGNMWSFDAQSGAVRWTHTIASYTGVVGDITRATPAVDAGRVIFGDQQGKAPHIGATVIAVSAATGALLWKTVVDAQDTAKITGAPVIDGGVVYLGMSSSEETSAHCCHFRGSVVALDAATGTLLWRTYTVPLGYTGGAVWGSSPVVDHSTGMLYVGTGNNYAVPTGICSAPAQTLCANPDPRDYSDSLLALSLTTGAYVWAMPTLRADVWTQACKTLLTCGPDFDFGSAPNLFAGTIGGISVPLVGIGQKSGIYWAVNAATGALVWQTRVGPGGGGGGIQWGSATDGNRIYVSITNSEHHPYILQPSGQTVTGGSFSALDPATGHLLWQTADPQGAPDLGFVSTANGVVYAGSSAGAGNTMYALDAASGQIRWQFASGGSVMGGAAIVDGTVYWASGYYGISPCPAVEPKCGSTYRLYAFGLPASPASPVVVAGQRGRASAVISWTPPTSGGSGSITGYRVSRDGKDSTGSGAYTTTVSAATRSFAMARLLAGATYNLTVSAIRSLDEGPAASAAVTIAPTPQPGAPMRLAVTQTAPSVVTVSWSPPMWSAGQAITGYRVARDGRDTSGTGAYATSVSPTTRSLALNRLRGDSTYIMSVRAVTAAGTGPAVTGVITVAN